MQHIALQAIVTANLTMRVWLVKDLEPLPTDGGNKRLMRSHMLCKALVKRGHEVTWITSSFDHLSKRQRANSDHSHQLGPLFSIQVLWAPGYKRNVGLARIRHNRLFARAFVNYAERASKRPDIIITDVPTTETAAAAIGLGKKWNVPTMLSIRDLWPDFFVNIVPEFLRPAARVLLWGFDRQVRYACRNASVIVGISPRYLTWGLEKGGRQKSELDAIIPLAYPSPPARPEQQSENDTVRLQRLGIDPAKKLVTFVGTWGLTYDLDTVAEAARLLESRDDIQFVLVGDGDQAGRLRTLVSDRKNIVTPGWVDARHISIVLHRTMVGLMPYRQDAPQELPNKFFEYMSHGVYQVSTLRGEAQRLLAVMKTGQTVVESDAGALAQAILEGIEQAAKPGTKSRIQGRFHQNYQASHIYAQFAQRLELTAASWRSSKSRYSQ